MSLTTLSPKWRERRSKAQAFDLASCGAQCLRDWTMPLSLVDVLAENPQACKAHCDTHLETLAEALC